MDEPFATRPALFGSWIANTALGNHAVSAELVETALCAHPDDARLHAELVFSYASQNRIEDAEKQLTAMIETARKYPDVRSWSEWQIYIEADRGLIAFRRGDAVAGGQHYRQAIELAVEQRLPQSATIAMLYLSREMARIDPEAAKPIAREVRTALSRFESLPRMSYGRVLDRAGLPADTAPRDPISM